MHDRRTPSLFSRAIGWGGGGGKEMKQIQIKQKMISFIYSLFHLPAVIAPSSKYIAILYLSSLSLYLWFTFF
jgi:hypothetical protein